MWPAVRGGGIQYYHHLNPISNIWYLVLYKLILVGHVLQLQYWQAKVRAIIETLLEISNFIGILKGGSLTLRLRCCAGNWTLDMGNPL